MNLLMSHKLNSLGTPAASLSSSLSSFFLLYSSGRAVRQAAFMCQEDVAVYSTDQIINSYLYLNFSCLVIFYLPYAV